MRGSRKNSKVKCKIDGCDRLAMYLAKELCQMHYFRVMRNGHPNRLNASEYTRGIRKRKDFFITPNGYKRIYSFNHPLARKHWVFEHRYVMYQKYGNNLPDCELCGKPTNWDTCHIDHKDENRLNNSESNLRPLCRPCNTNRTQKSTTPRFEYKGEKLTVTQLSKLDGAQTCRAQIKRRLDSGLNVQDAVFGLNKTHPKTNS